MENYRKVSIIFIFLLFHFLTFYAFSSENNKIIELISPCPNSTVISKKPVIKCFINRPFKPKTLLVTLDYTDITSMLKISPYGFEFKPLQVLPSGLHTLTIKVELKELGSIEKEFKFKTSHYEKIDEFYSSNQLSGIFESVVEKPDNRKDIPYSKAEANLNSKTELRIRKWTSSFTTNLRYKDQSLPLPEPEKKGISVIDYIFQSKYGEENKNLTLELGDIQIDETEYSVQGLNRRGGRISLKHKNFEIKGFSVLSEQQYGFRKDIGISFSSKDHILGASAQCSFLSDKITVKSIYVKGGEKGESFGIWTASNDKKGKVFGILIKTDFFEDKLVTQTELYRSIYDPDTSDEFSSEKDRAYKITLEGNVKEHFYSFVYEYVGPKYETIGNQTLQNDKEGFSALYNIDFEKHSFSFGFSRYNDNLKKDPLYPRIYTYSGSIDYVFKGISSLPIEISYQKVITESTNEPDSFYEVDNSTDTLLTNLTLTRDKWNFCFQISHSVQMDKTSANNDSKTTTLTLSPSYLTDNLSIQPSFSFNRSTFLNLGYHINTYTLTLNFNAQIIPDKLSYELSGTYDYQVASDGSVDQENISTDFNLSYKIGQNLFGYLNPSLVFRTQYYKTKDKVYDHDEEGLILLVMITTDLSFSF